MARDDRIAYLQALPQGPEPRVVVRDHARRHAGKAVPAVRPALAQLGISGSYLPSVRPTWNAIEPVFKQVTHHAIAKRSHPSNAELRATVEQGVETDARKLRPKGDKQHELDSAASTAVSSLASLVQVRQAGIITVLTSRFHIQLDER